MPILCPQLMLKCCFAAIKDCGQGMDSMMQKEAKNNRMMKKMVGHHIEAVGGSAN